MRIVVDSMGGDNAPFVTVRGAVEAVNEYNLSIILTGDKGRIEGELSKYNYPKERIEVNHASEIIEMDESPAISVRRKKDSSINVGINLLREKKADAFVSAGNTGAVACASVLMLGLLKGIERPAIAVIMPNLIDVSLLIDVGANIDPKPEHLYQYAIMGTIYFEHILNKTQPKVGLLNVGEEETKGTDFLKESYRLLQSSKINFIGNVEGRDIFTGKSDVIVCDGLVGNVVLKVSESLAETMSKLLKRELKRNFFTRIGAFLSIPAFMTLKKKIDYSEYGGAPLLGVDGICIISHGHSSSKAIKNAIRVACEFVSHRINEKIVEAITAQ
ncbi:MAG: phosphate acyltransferase PlsX [Candidatus Omnitrophica bacterium]|nr:phosphate acyltransferase PlsX [Candidatus Omnitrophota bacterium]